jgi:hypothetical protein
MRALLISLTIALLLPLKGLGFTIRSEAPPSTSKNAFACMIGQLSHAVELSKHSLFDETYFITPQNLGIRSPSLFIQEKDAENYVLNPDFYKALFEELRTLFDRHDKGLLVAGTVKEAGQITRYLNQTVPGKKFAILHAGLEEQKRESIQALYEKGKINFLVVVDRLEEPSHYPGMSFYVDLNRDIHPQSFLRGMKQVLPSRSRAEQVDIISLMELTQSNLDASGATFKRTLKGNLSNQMRVELSRFREEMERVGNPIIAADETIEHISRYGAVPNRTDRALFQRFETYKSHPAFLARVRKNRKAWKIFKLADDSAREDATTELINYFLREKRVPPMRNRRLYKLFYQYREDPIFIAKVKDIPEAWEVFQKSPLRKNRMTAAERNIQKDAAIILTAPEKSAKEVIAYILQYKELPPRKSKIYPRYFLYRDDPSFIETMKEDPEAWKIFNKLWLIPARKAAVDVINYILIHKEVPPRSSELYSRFHTYRGNPDFIRRMKKNAVAWKIFSRFNLSAAEKAALDVIDHILIYGDVPPSSHELYARYYKYRNDPKFIAMLKENPKAWEKFQNASIRKNRSSKTAETASSEKSLALTAPEKIAMEVIAYILKHGKVPPRGSDLYRRYLTHRDDPVFIAKLKENPKVWKIFSSPKLTPREKAAEAVIDYVSLKDELPPTDSALYKRLYRYQDDEEFIAKLKEHPKTWELYKKWRKTQKGRQD